MNAAQWFQLGFGAGCIFAVLSYAVIAWLMRERPEQNKGLVHPTVCLPPPPEPTAEQIARWSNGPAMMNQGLPQQGGNCIVCLKPRDKCSGIGPCAPAASAETVTTILPVTITSIPRFGQLTIPDDARLKGDSNFQHRPEDYWRNRYQPPPQL